MLWDDLQAFVGAAEAGSLSAVARRLGCTQPAVGQRVRRLERELGVALLERRRSGVVLTTAGTALYEAAVDATGRLHTALETVRRLRGDERPLRVAAADILARWFMIAPLAAFRSDHPELDVHIRDATSAAVAIEDVHTGLVDMAFMTLASPPPMGLDQQPVVRTPWSLVTALDDPVGSRPSLRLADINSRRLICSPVVPGSSTNPIVESAFAAEGVTLQRHLIIRGWDTQLLMAEAGIGHAIIPDLWLDAMAARVASRRLPQIPPLTFGWVSRRWTSLPPAAHDYAQRVHENLTGLARDNGVHIFPFPLIHE